MNKEWDHLIVLDACRYDYFAKLYHNFLAGNIKKAVSLAFKTEYWCKKNFTTYYEDVVYVSSNPIINSKVEVLGFDAKEHFFDIIDVWNWGWDEKQGVVPPDQVNKGVMEAKRKYPEKKLIIHYMQPHAPYLRPGKGEEFISFCNSPEILVGKSNQKKESKGLRGVLSKAKNKIFYLGSSAWDLIPNFLPCQRLLWKIREAFGFSSRNPEEIALRKLGEEEVHLAYEETLLYVLKYVSELVDNLRGKIVITADHGELLGEGGEYGHATGPTSKLLEIPYFEVKK